MRRRDFFKKSAAAALGLGLMSTFPVPGYSKIKGANGKLNIAQVGVAGMQGDFHLAGSASENRFALRALILNGIQRKTFPCYGNIPIRCFTTTFFTAF